MDMRPSKGFVGYVILAVSVAFALWASRENSIGLANERAARSVELNAYLKRHCQQVSRKDSVFIGILAASRDRARTARQIDPAVRRDYVARTNRDIAEIRAADRRCVTDIPPPLPTHTDR